MDKANSTLRVTGRKRNAQAKRYEPASKRVKREKQPDLPDVLAYFTDRNKDFHKIDEKRNCYDILQVGRRTEEEYVQLWDLYKAYCKTWYGYRNRGTNPVSDADWNYAVGGLWTQIENKGNRQVILEDEIKKQEILDAPLYQPGVNRCTSKDLLDPDYIFLEKCGEKFDINRCTVYGENAILGGPYYNTLGERIHALSQVSKISEPALISEFG